MQGTLFTRDFLDQGIAETRPWQGLGADALDAFRAGAAAVLGAVPGHGNLNEAVTEREVILPIFRALGWSDVLSQQAADARGRENVPDLLLFADAAAREQALAEHREDRRYRHGLAIVESKRWGRPLDRGDAADPQDDRAPSSQMLRYLSQVERLSEQAVRWGILTNGRLWRLYWQGARSRSEEFLELDLVQLAALPGIQPDLFAAEAQAPEHFLRVFFLLFRREAFLPDPGDAGGRSFHELARDESRHWEQRVSQDLGNRVFEDLFPRLLAALVAGDPQAPTAPDAGYLEEVRRAGLTFLYRLLFLLYAEDRHLLPVRDRRYDDYSLRRIREDIARRIDQTDVFSAAASRYHAHLADLFRAVNVGDPSIGLPPYDGGLFDPALHPFLERARLPDAALAPLVDGLCRLEVGPGGERRWINYRDLSVQHLGSIYERLLEYDAVADGEGGVAIRPNPFARRTSGSFYTHDDLVGLILDRALGPQVEERVDAFSRRAEALAHDRRPREERLRELAALDPAERLLDLKVCDPAMGSGHFLVSLVDYLADRVLLHMAEAEDRVPWAPEDRPYRSPLADRLAGIRARILEAADREGWTLERDQLDDRHLVRRMVLKRAVHGVDKNPMAVELAKVALWLHTFTVGAPLSFLNHHLRCGDSLFGEWVATVDDELRRRGALFFHNALARMGLAAQAMTEISELTDADIAEVVQSKTRFGDTDDLVRPLARFLDFWQALRWLSPGRGAPEGLAPLLDGVFGDVLALVAADDPETLVAPEQRAAAAPALDLLRQAREVAQRERFFHWEVAFPTVWRELYRGLPRGGFDAVIGNPPWDRMKLQEVEWFAARRPEIARAARAADRKRLVARLQADGDPLWRDCEEARSRAEAAAAVARGSGAYPLLSGGDVNLYSLFVEQSQRLAGASGAVGLLTPSGIASDKGASVFFRSVATTGRLAALLDFENKKTFFPDVDSRFKFCALVFGGAERRFDQAECATFLHGVGELRDPERVFSLTAADFAAVNPNTGTAPVFRTRRDAALTTAVYGRHPVLVDRRADPPRQPWPVRYATLFHMTNDSGLFRRRDELEAAGFYPVAGNRWRRGAEEYVPLYEGKMVQAYDHRAASVVVNPENVHRPAQPEPATAEQHADPRWCPAPQFWVPKSEVAAPPGLEWAVGFKEITAPTNMRTMIAAAVPLVGFGNKVPLFLPTEDTDTDAYRRLAPLLLANLNSFAFDFVARQKLHGQTLNLFILEQLPVIAPAAFDADAGGRPLGDRVRDEVLRLSYTAWDLAPLARDLGYAGDPFPWDEEDRRHRAARLDALFFHLYGFGRDDAAYVLDTFPIVAEKDRAEFGRYRTKDLILAYRNAVAAGDWEAVVDA